MKLAEFLTEEERRIRYFSAYWRENMRIEAMTGGDPRIQDDTAQWPDDMEAGLWDEMLSTFSVKDAHDIGIYLDGDEPDPGEPHQDQPF